MKFCRVLRVVAVVLAIATVRPACGQTLYSEDFDVDDSANWTVNRRTQSNANDSPVDLFFDYSTVGIPSAPNSAGGTTRGIKLQANMQGAGLLADPDALIGVSVSPTSQAFTGDYVLKVDVWSNFLGPMGVGATGSTMLTGMGILSSGTTHNTPGQTAGAGGIDGVFFTATGDGQNAADYRAYSRDRVISYQVPHLDSAFDGDATHHANNGDASRNNSSPYYVSAFPSHAAPAAQTALYPATQTGSTAAGAFGMAWHEVEVKKVGDVITWTADGTLLITVNAADFISSVGGGNITLSHADVNFTTNTTDPAFFDLQFSLFDNVRVEALAATESADFDEDGDTDGADFLAWQRGVGIDDGSADLADGDANDDGNVDGDDLAIWEDQFGTASAASASIPEPSTALMAAVLSVVAFFTRRQLAPAVARRS